jgi:hypothetical protein
MKNRYTPLPYDRGAIKRILIVMPYGVAVDNDLLKKYLKGMLLAFNPDIEFWVIASLNQTYAAIGNPVAPVNLHPLGHNDFDLGEPSEEQLFRRIKIIEKRVDFERLFKEIDPHGIYRYNPSGYYQPWVQDYFNVLQNANGSHTILLRGLYTSPAWQPATQEFCDLYTAEEVALHDNHYSIRPTRLYLPGGNVIFGKSDRIGDFVLIGHDILVHNLKSLFITDYSSSVALADLAKKLLTAEIKNATGVNEVIWMDNTLALDQRQPVYHLDLYISLAGRAADDRQIILVAELDTSLFSEDQKKLQQTVDTIAALDDAYQYLAEKYGDCFDVRRIPIWAEFKFANGFLLFSYNNMLVEEREKKMIAYMPSYLKLDGSPSMLGFQKLMQKPDPALQQLFATLPDAKNESGTGLSGNNKEGENPAQYIGLPPSYTQISALGILSGQEQLKAFEKKVHQVLETIFDEVIPVGGNFNNDALQLASLHCYAKVLNREYN